MVRTAGRPTGPWLQIRGLTSDLIARFVSFFEALLPATQLARKRGSCAAARLW